MEIKDKDFIKALEMMNKVSVVGVSNMASLVTAYQLLTGVATVEEKKGEGENGTE